MKVELVPRSGSPAQRSVEHVLARFSPGELPLPHRIFIDDGDGAWLSPAVLTPVSLRHRSVIAAADDATLRAAVHLEIGGAVRLPVSASALATACAAADALGGSTVAPPATDDLVDGVVGGGKGCLAVGWRRPRFWRHHLGGLVQRQILTELAADLGRPPVIAAGPVLVLGGGDPAEIVAAANRRRPELVIVPIDDSGRTAEPDVETAMSSAGAGSQPVMELPAGHRVGWWSLTDEPGPDGREFRAVVHDDGGGRFTWELTRSDGARISIDEMPDSIDRDRPVVKLPGWIGGAIRPGSPAGVLAAAAAGHPDRLGRPLWISNVDADAIRILLSFEGPVWVDGPGVPE